MANSATKKWLDITKGHVHEAQHKITLKFSSIDSLNALFHTGSAKILSTTPVAVVSSFAMGGQFLSIEVIIIHLPCISLFMHLVGVAQFFGTNRILLPKLGSQFMARKILRIVLNLRQVSVRSSGRIIIHENRMGGQKP